MSAPFDRPAPLAWMRSNLDAHRDRHTDDVNLTSLAEACADAFGVDDEGGPLDDPDHWIWEVAVEAEEEASP